jgi:Zn-dependent protease with chaperone function
MRFVGRKLGESAENSSGGGTGGTLRETATLAALVVFAMAVLYFIVAVGTDILVFRISPERETSIFGSFQPNQKFVAEIPENYTERWALLQSVLDKLAAHEDVVPLDYRLVLIESLDPNAFAFPGGAIGVTSGLLDSLEGEIPIAFVLGHELGHFANRDHLKSFGRRLGFTVAVQVLFGGGLDSLTSKGRDLMLLKYSRGQEARADLFAMNCLDSVYGNHDGAGRLFEILSESKDLPDWAYMFSTHPDSQKRLQELFPDN